VALRAGDGFDNVVQYMPTMLPGHWQPDPVNPDQEAWGPEWGGLTTFGLTSAAQIVVPPIGDMTSQEYAAAYNDVKSIGRDSSTTRTAEQTEIGLFWALDRVGMGTPMVIYTRALINVARSQGNDLWENAHLFALAGTAMADAGCVAWDAKFTYDFWRPVTGIRQGDLDGNPDTIADPTWTPLGAPGGTENNFTPPFPTYISGHATFGGAVFTALERFYGTDSIPFQLESPEVPGVVRSYSSFTEAMAENGRSRVYLGVHWSFDDLVGRDVGTQIADYIASNYFAPVESCACELDGSDGVNVFDLLAYLDCWFPAASGAPC
jgi:membrane-associated phospholipid phosphatase